MSERYNGHSIYTFQSYGEKVVLGNWIASVRKVQLDGRTGPELYRTGIMPSMVAATNAAKAWIDSQPKPTPAPTPEPTPTPVPTPGPSPWDDKTDTWDWSGGGGQAVNTRIEPGTSLWGNYSNVDIGQWNTASVWSTTWTTGAWESQAWSAPTGTWGGYWQTPTVEAWGWIQGQGKEEVKSFGMFDLFKQWFGNLFG